MISFILLFALAFAALPTEQTACTAFTGAEWIAAQGQTPAKCQCKAATPNYFEEKQACVADTECVEDNNEQKDGTTCKCKNEFVYFAGKNKCISKTDCKDELNMKQDTTGKICECKGGFKLQGEECVVNTAQCTGQNQVYFEEKKECIAKDNCKDENNQVLSGTTCKCKEDSYFDGTGCDKRPVCNPKCTGNQVCTINGCQDKMICDENSHVPLYDEIQNSCYACLEDGKPLYNKQTKKCEACPQDKPVYFYDALKCIAKADCKIENNQLYLEDENQCVCPTGTKVNGDICEAECDASKYKVQTEDKKKCKCMDTFKAKAGTGTAETPLVCECVNGQIKKDDKNVIKCVTDGVNALFLVLALTIFFLF